jgi:hypothetical protein
VSSRLLLQGDHSGRSSLARSGRILASPTNHKSLFTSHGRASGLALPLPELS